MWPSCSIAEVTTDTGIAGWWMSAQAWQAGRRVHGEEVGEVLLGRQMGQHGMWKLQETHKHTLIHDFCAR